MDTTSELQAFHRSLNEQYQLSCTLSLLRWDQAVCLPAKGAAGRAAQISYLSALLHQKRCDTGFAERVDRLAAELDSFPEDQQVNIREVKRTVDRARKLPNEFIAATTRLQAEAYSAWVEARRNDDFAAVQPYLERLFAAARQEADYVGFEEHPYDALLDKYEPHCRLSRIKPLFEELAEALSEMVPLITARQASKVSALPMSVSQQTKWCTAIAGHLGYSLDSGRLDPTAHPFESTIGPGDVRITTRYDESNALSSLYSTIHEVGHALYELGLPQQHLGTPLGRSISLGIHESQSRLWENCIGRSNSFCRFLSANGQKLFGEKFLSSAIGTNSLPADQYLWQSCNWVEPSFIRVEADEVSYSLHIIIRTLLEEELLSNSLRVEDLPEAWNDLYHRYLGITPSNYRDGVLQDVHWYHGGIGYFPTYALGNLYAAMFLAKMEEDNPAIWNNVASGNFRTILDWLQQHIHCHGMRYGAEELVERVTGKPLHTAEFINYLRNKFLPDTP